MQILFDAESVSFDLIDSPLMPIYQRILSHLRHVDIPFRRWDSIHRDHDSVDHLIEYGAKVGIDIDQIRCRALDQDYLNFLHQIYEKNYDGDPKWLDFHEHIHLCEKSLSIHVHQRLHIDWREKAGILEKTFDPDWLATATTQIKAGDVFVEWAELGKTPFMYWNNKEPNDIVRIKELCKPWLKLRPKIIVALEDHDYYKTSKEFDQWWQCYHDEWCQHWNISKWDVKDMFSKLVFGHMSTSQLDKLKTLLLSEQTPRRILL